MLEHEKNSGGQPVLKRQGSIKMVESCLGVSPGNHGGQAIGGGGGQLQRQQQTTAKQAAMEKNHLAAMPAWKAFADHVGQDGVNKFLNTRKVQPL